MLSDLSKRLADVRIEDFWDAEFVIRREMPKYFGEVEKFIDLKFFHESNSLRAIKDGREELNHFLRAILDKADKNVLSK